MSITTIKKLIISSTVVQSFKNKTFRVFDEDGFTKEASILAAFVIILIAGIAGGIEMG
ncbi:hypothetical protein [Carnobacterium jeotgali]|uniref:hypothetical protein n=1 Tax=Carnobacterium jeotgali TaxID=545534 RepID=UPI000B315DCA|nr:hypothetical protein [Carnobacterium jeotgali]